MSRGLPLQPDFGHSLLTAIEQAGRLAMVRKGDLSEGDTVMIRTSNSVYVLRVAGNNLFAVSGGWFDRNGLSPMLVPIRGCTWGGSIIKVDIVAACGLRVEFGNRVTTSPVRTIALMRASGAN
ncbi:MAG: hypothetical protein WBG01_11945 [Bacteroidota bacterium]